MLHLDMDLLQEGHGDEFLDITAIGDTVLAAMKVESLKRPSQVQRALCRRLYCAFHRYIISVHPPPHLLHHLGDRCHRLFLSHAVFRHIALHGAGRIILALSQLRALVHVFMIYIHRSIQLLMKYHFFSNTRRSQILLIFRRSKWFSIYTFVLFSNYLLS